MTLRPVPSRHVAIAECAFAAITVLTCAGLVIAAVLAGAPAAAVPLIAAVCVGAPILATWGLSTAVMVLRASRRGEGQLDRRALARLRRRLDKLPETPHPLALITRPRRVPRAGCAGLA